MISPSLTAANTLEKPAVAKPIRSSWLPGDAGKPRVNASYDLLF